MIPLTERIAAAPITWGVDGSPGWGYLLPAPRVLEEMAEVGFSATELGPDGFLGRSPRQARAAAAAAGLSVVGGFVPLGLHGPDPDQSQATYADRAISTLAACGSAVLVLGPTLPHDGYDRSGELTAEEWSAFDRNLKGLVERAAQQGLEVALHQHWGMAVERPWHLDRVLTCTDVSLCLDTGHMFLADIDPVEVARSASDRVAHVHLKDVDAAAAARVRAGDVPFRQAVKTGMFRPLGEGDVDVGGVISALEGSGYQGWYVLEQDSILAEEPAPGEGPLVEAGISAAYLQELAPKPEAPPQAPTQ